jgi:hypothetical protein
MKPGQPQLDDRETRSAVALTVAWMLSCMSTAAGMFVVVAFRLLMLAFPVPVGAQHPFGRIASVLLFAALITGVLCLALTPLAHRVRATRPPRSVTMGAVLIGLSPIVLLVVLSMLPGQ